MCVRVCVWVYVCMRVCARSHGLCDSCTAGACGQAGHGGDGAADGEDEAGADAGPDLPDREHEVAGRPDQLGVVGEGVLRLGHADRHLVEPGVIRVVRLV